MSYEMLTIEAYRLTEEGRYLEAGLKFLEAAASAHAVGDWTKVMLWKAVAFQVLGKAGARGRRRLELLIDIRRLMWEFPSKVPENLNTNFRALVAESYFFHLLDYRPNLADLERALEGLGELSRPHWLWARSRLLRARGLNDEARLLLEAAWVDRDTINQHQPVIALDAFYINLVSGRRSDAIGWLSVAKRELASTPCPNCETNILRADVELALASQATEPRVLGLVNRFTHHRATVQYYVDTADFVEVRANLRFISNGDPGIPSHPSFGLLSRRGPGDEGMLRLQERMLVSLDYRIASLRYTAGILPVDDTYYWTPQDLASVAVRNDDEFALRLKKTQIAIRLARVWAEAVDGCLATDWRKTEVDAREERVAQIISAVRTKKGPR
jgi:hypothetical protein